MTHLLVWPEAFYVFQLNQNSYDEREVLLSFFA